MAQCDGCEAVVVPLERRRGCFGRNFGGWEGARLGARGGRSGERPVRGGNYG